MSFDVLVSSDELESVYGSPSEAVLNKVIDHVDAHCSDFIARSPFVLVATADADGTCDVSPKGGAPGFVQVIDERRLAIPDAPGNRLVYSLRNIAATGRAGLLFVIPGLEETLRVNGRAAIVRDEDVLDSLAAKGKRPLVAIGVEIEECFLHCPKAFRRSQLWEPEAWPDRSILPSMACVLYDKLQPEGKSLEDYVRESEEGIQKTLY